jgi:phosphoglycolate phosphatase
MLQKAMQEIGVDACVYVGDSEVDLRTAENAGAPCLSVLWGFRSREDLEQAGAVHLCRRPEDMASMIDALARSL